ncbi:unnamed protein product [Parajaminaea phylloscopi]
MSPPTDPSRRPSSGRERTSSSSSSLASRLREYEREDAQEGREEAAEVKQIRTGQGVAASHGPDGRTTPSSYTVADTPTEACGDIDVEKQASSPARASSEHDAKPDKNLVTWDSPDDPTNPRNWPIAKRWTSMIIVSVVTFLSPLASSIVAPSLPDIAEQFGIESQVQANMVLSVFILAFAIAPLFLGPTSELFGRKPVIQGCNAFFILFNMACALSQSQGQLTAFRFLSGIGGAAPLTVGGGTVADLFGPEERGVAMAVYSLAPLLGPALGPVFGGMFTYWVGPKGWRWAFGMVSIVSAMPGLLAFFLLDETYGPRILQKKCYRLRKETGNQDLHTAVEKSNVSWQQRFRTNFVRPFILLGTQPIVQVLAAYLSVIYGTVYLLLTSFDQVFRRQYNENTLVASLHYLSLGIGFTLGGQTAGRVIDRVYGRLKAKNGGVGQPEMKMPFMMFTTWTLPAGLIIYGFSVQYKVFWLVPDIGALLFGFGMMSTFLSCQAYLVDAYTTFAASALASVGFCRSLAGFGLPLAAGPLYDRLGYDYGNLLLAGIAALVGLPAPILFYKYGAWLRARSPYAAGALT